jgi:IS30 family transposase
MSYKHLNIEERHCIIKIENKKGTSQSGITKALGEIKVIFHVS